MLHICYNRWPPEPWVRASLALASQGAGPMAGSHSRGKKDDCMHLSSQPAGARMFAGN